MAGTRDFIIAYGLLVVGVVLGVAVLIIGVLAVIEEIGFRRERRRHRYQLQQQKAEGEAREKNGRTGHGI